MALFHVTHGLYTLTAKSRDRLNGQCLDALMQASSAPPCIVIGVGDRSSTHAMICESGRDVNKFVDFDHVLNEHGIPYLPDAVAVYDCTVIPEMTLDLGTHSLFTASVDHAATADGGQPLTYNDYRNTLRKERS